MKNPFAFEAEPFLGYSPDGLQKRESAGQFGQSEWLEPEFEEKAKVVTASPVKACILWPALGFPAVIAPRQGASSNPGVTDASHSTCILVLTAKPLTREEAARYLRYVPWQER